MSKPTPLRTVSEAIDALGGSKAVSELVGCKIASVTNWRHSRFPPNTYLQIEPVLRAAGYDAPPSLWGMRTPTGHIPAAILRGQPGPVRALQRTG